MFDTLSDNRGRRNRLLRRGNRFASFTTWSVTLPGRVDSDARWADAEIPGSTWEAHVVRPLLHIARPA